MDLSPGEKFAFARGAVLAQLREVPGGVRVALGFGDRGGGLLECADPPDGTYARRAYELAGEAYGPELLRHCLRCWYLGDLFAQREDRDYDRERFYVACLLHDIALADGYRPTSGDARCFAVHGGRVTARFLRTWGADTDFRETVEAAIAAHLDVAAPPEHGVEAYLLHAAARLDVAGARVAELPGRLLHRVNEVQPRAKFVSTFSRVLREEARERPDSRIAVLWRTGMVLPMALNPIGIAS